ncbi:hypothetical protein FRC08_002755 [Ceratobasidium sp. 394]|nr:hypothetical protein FRC08_002755 [Ceratobasidium sp. 394]
MEGASLGDAPEGERQAQDPNDASDPLNIAKLVSEINVIEAIRAGYESDSQFGRIMLSTQGIG